MVQVLLGIFRLANLGFIKEDLNNLLSKLVLLQRAFLVVGYKGSGNGDQSNCFEENHFSYDQLRLATDDFHSSNKIGRGGFGTVYQELTKYINHCNEIKAATIANKGAGQLSIVKLPPEYFGDVKEL